MKREKTSEREKKNVEKRKWGKINWKKKEKEKARKIQGKGKDEDNDNDDKHYGLERICKVRKNYEN